MWFVVLYICAMKHTFDIKALVSDFENTRIKKSDHFVRVGKRHEPRPMSLRTVSSECGVTTTTLSRMTRHVGFPDMPTLLSVCSWMSMSPKKYFVPAEG